jgi:hypothetical protein
MNIKFDRTLEYLLDLDGVRYVVDDIRGWWVKFEVKKITLSVGRPYGIKYALSLHDRMNQRMMGFDNAHAIDGHDQYDHWHVDGLGLVKPYFYKNAAKLLEDFWGAVDRKIKEISNET